MLKKLLRIFFTVLLIYTHVDSVTDFDTFNCTELVPLLRKEYFTDNFLLSRLISENEDLNSLIKYVNYSILNINKQLKESCSDFSGTIKEQLIYCPQRPLYPTCRQALQQTSGVYRLRTKRNSSTDSFLVYCLEDGKGGDPWTIIQRRQGNDISFNQNWNDYENGFGNIYGSYWLGLAEISALLRGQIFELWILLQDFENTTHSAYYDEFSIGDKESHYHLASLGAFTGTAGNSLTDSLGKQFTTAFDEDGEGFDCAKNTKSGWWFNDCGESNLNGEYYENIETGKKGKGIFWNGWRGFYYSYKYVHMAIRERPTKEC